MTNYVEHAQAVTQEIEKVVIGKKDCIQKVMMAILSKGHILIEDIPGVGKTTLALAFSKVMELHQNRVQFTPDVLASDILGFSMYDKETGNFKYQPGPIICNLFLADEINRTSPKTQSALLEVMEEERVTVDGRTWRVPAPFTVMATQNPIGSAGTQKLPDSQLDRFMVRISMGYPDIKDEINIVKNRTSKNLFDGIKTIISKAELVEMQRQVEAIYVHDTVYDYIGNLVTATRSHTFVSLGLSPRGTIALAKMAKASAFLTGRKYVVPDDVYSVFSDIAMHRIQLKAKANMLEINAASIIKEILQKTHKPAPESYVGG